MEQRTGDDEKRNARIEALTDGVYAIAMTLMVLNIEVPESVDIQSAGDLFHALAGMWQVFFNYALCFAIIISMWLRNNRIHRHVKIVTNAFTLNALITLMFVCLLPFSVSLMGDFPDNAAAEVVFHVNLLVLGALTMHQFLHFRMNKQLLHAEHRDDVDDMSLATVAMIYLGAPLLALVATVFSPGYSTLCYLLMPIIGAMMPKPKRKRA